MWVHGLIAYSLLLPHCAAYSILVDVTFFHLTLQNTYLKNQVLHSYRVNEVFGYFLVAQEVLRYPLLGVDYLWRSCATVAETHQEQQ